MPFSVAAPTDPTARGLVSIILPTYNERENILTTVGAVLKAVGDPVEVLVVDDDSPDQTWKLVEQLGDARVRVIRRRGVRGLASAVNRGLIEARGELIGWMDVDHSMPAELLSEMVRRTRQVPVVIGSRYVAGGGDVRPRLRVLTSRWVNGLASIVLGGGVKDYDSGFIVVRREVFDRVTLLPVGYGAYFIDFIYHCRKRGLEVLELPYTLVDRTQGTSKSMPSLGRFFLQGLGYILTIFQARLRP
ncbi:MAG: glycosyltransferase [Anaerolineales bacterium]